MKKYHELQTDVKDNVAWNFFKNKNAKSNSGQQKRIRGQIELDVSFDTVTSSGSDQKSLNNFLSFLTRFMPAPFQ